MAQKPHYPQVQRGHPLNQGLYSAWLVPAADRAIGEIRDYSGFNRHAGSSVGTLSIVPGAFGGGAINFNGGGTDYATVTSFVIIGARQSVFARYNTTTAQNSKRMVTQGNSFNLATNSSGNVSFSVSNGNNAAGDALKTDGYWHSLLGTFDGTTARIYHDGFLVGSAGDSLTTTTFDFGLGASPYYGGSYTGKLDDIRVWSRDLKESEARFLHSTSFNEFRLALAPELLSQGAAAPPPATSRIIFGFPGLITVYGAKALLENRTLRRRALFNPLNWRR